MKEPRIPVCPPDAKPGWAWGLMARNADSMGWAEYAVKCREMAERSRRAGRDISANESKPEPRNETQRQTTLWDTLALHQKKTANAIG